MNRLFAETYAKDQEIEARYDAAELKKLEDDAEYRRLRAEQRACAAQVPGLVVPHDR